MIVTVFAIVIALSLIDFKKTVLCLAPLHLLLVMTDFPGVPASLFEVTAAALWVIFFIKAPFSSFKSIAKFPFLPCIAISLMSIVGTNYLISPHWPTSMLRFNASYLFPILIWMNIDEKKDLKLILNAFLVFSTFMGLYVLFEVAAGTNPYILYLIRTKLGNVNVLNYTEIRFGFKRCQGFLSTPASSGFVFGLVLMVTYFTESIVPFLKKWGVFFWGGCFVASLLSGTRSVIAASCVSWAGIFFDQVKKADYFLIKIAAIMVGAFFGGNYILEIADSFVNTNAVAGSNTDMRMEQLAISLYYWMQSPIWGNGAGFIWSFVKDVDSEILGAESVWFQLLVDYGIMGVIAYVVCILNVGYVLFKRNWKWFFLPLAFALGKTLSSILGIEISFLFILSIILIKHDLFMEMEKGGIVDEKHS